MNIGPVQLSNLDDEIFYDLFSGTVGNNFCKFKPFLFFVGKIAHKCLEIFFQNRCRLETQIKKMLRGHVIFCRGSEGLLGFTKHEIKLGSPRQCL